MNKYITKINNIDVTFTLSDKKGKKLKASFINPKTGKENNIYFGDPKYKHYYDRTHLLNKDLNHYDKKRRELYRQRHKNDNLTSLSPGFFSWYFLW